jgi:integrase
MTLTISEIKNAKPGPKPYKLADSKGLFLLVTPTGGKSWRYKYRFGAKERLLTLGLYPDLGLAAARLAHEDARRLVLSGKDPVLEAQKEKRQKIEAAAATFRRLGDEWLKDQKPVWSSSHAKRVENRLERDLYPAFGNVPIGEVDGAVVLRALRKIEARGSIETAKRVRGYVESIFKRAKGERLVAATAVLEVAEVRDALKPTPKGSKQPALTTLPQLLELQLCVDRSTSDLITKLASRLLALTAVRIGVLRTAMWTEFEGIDWHDPDVISEKPIWKISAERMKLEVEEKGDAAFGHDVPLSLQAIGVLRVLRIITGSGPFLFPGAKTWREPMSDASVSSMYKRMGAGRFKNRMVPHGWRTSFSTVMNERAAELERDGDRMVIDMALAHVPPGMSSSEWAYNRARYRKPRGVLLQVWADLINEGLPSPWTLLPRSAAVTEGIGDEVVDVTLVPGD